MVFADRVAPITLVHAHFPAAPLLFYSREIAMTTKYMEEAA